MSPWLERFLPKSGRLTFNAGMKEKGAQPEYQYIHTGPSAPSF